MTIPTLAKSPVVFYPEEHKYMFGDKELKGVTSTLVKRVYPIKTPDGMTEEEWQLKLNNAAERGTKVHEIIERYEDNFDMCDAPELYGYLEEKTNNSLTHVASEYLISDEKHYASKIDHVFVDQDGGIVIVDIKTNYTPPYEKTALQLSIYKWLFERQNPKLKVSKCAMIWLRESKHEYRELTPWAEEMVDELIQADINDLPFDIHKTYGDLPAKVFDVQVYLKKLEQEVKVKTEELKAIKDGLCLMMLERNIKTFSTDVMKMTTVTPKPRETFDAKAFAKDHPDLYREYVKISEVKPSVRITFT